MDPNKPRPRVMSSLSIPRPRAKTPVTSSIPKPTSTPSTPSKLKPKPATRPTLTPKSSNPHLNISPKKSATPLVQKERKEEFNSSKPAPSLKEVIAQKRAEARKLKSTSPTLSHPSTLGDDVVSVVLKKPQEEAEDFGRWSLRETIERARSTGALNISSRDLPCIPSALFEIHLGLNPEPLKLVQNEPPLAQNDPTAVRRRATKDINWYDAKDLEVIKAWNNKILELQPELSLFGSLKTLDLNNNELTLLPESICDLSSLTYIDLSHNSLESLPESFFALPDLATLRLSHNKLTSLPFDHSFEPANMQRLRQRKGNDFFSLDIRRADKPLPSLLVLDVSFNNLPAAGINHMIPTSLVKFDISSNPLGHDARPLILQCSRLSSLKELLLNQADIDDGAFPEDLFSDVSEPYPRLQSLDLGETKVTETTIRSAFSSTSKVLDFELTNSTQELPEGMVKVAVGKRIVKEAWELEAERRVEKRRGPTVPSDVGLAEGGKDGASNSGAILKGPWEHDPPLTEGQRRLAQSRTTTSMEESCKIVRPSQASPVVDDPPPKPDPVKEAWEIEADEGLTVGAQRLRRAKLAAQRAEVSIEGRGESKISPENLETPQPPHSLATSKYYVVDEHALTLPPSSAPTKSFTHTRSFSVSHSATQGPPSDLAVPTPTLPLSYILDHFSLSATLRVLKLNKRRLDQSFSLPPLTNLPEEGLLPKLEELSFESCGLGDTVSCFEGDDPSKRKSESILPLLAKLFPSILSLNLTHNNLTSHGLTTSHLSELLLHKATPLRQLELSSNRITHLEGFVGLAEMFKGNRELQKWKMETLDLRDNEIGKLPAELGLLPLDVFLVDGNTFRIPPRRVWEREGTKGLLSWLRGRLD